MTLRRIDAHHHLWDAATGHYPMLSSVPVERFWGNTGELPPRYAIADYLADARAAGVVASVHIEAGFAPTEGEAAAMQAIADVHGFPQAFLTRIDLAAPDAPARIAADAGFANWRGVRLTANWHQDPARRGCADPGLLADPAWRRGYAALGPVAGVADLMIWPGQLAAAADLARSFPDIALVIEHFGLADGDPTWDTGMALLAALPNVAVKLSGPGLVDRRWSMASIRPLIRRLLDLFGSDRLMIGSNAPVDLLHADFAMIVARFDAALDGLPAADINALWHDTAARLYRISGSDA